MATMGTHVQRGARFTTALAALILVAMPSGAGAVHFYRGPGGGCTPASGSITDDTRPSAPVAATVQMLHNSFNDTSNNTPITMIKVGQAVRWTWNSEHCHSVQAVEPAAAFYSKFHYPTATPTTPPLNADFFAYPVPTMTPTLRYTHTFTAAGMFRYQCEHHATIGMVGVVIVS